MAIKWIEIDIGFDEGNRNGNIVWNLVQKWPRWGYPQSHLKTPMATYAPFHELGGEFNGGVENVIGDDLYDLSITRSITQNLIPNDGTLYTWSYVDGLTYTPLITAPHYQTGYDGSKIIIYFPSYFNSAWVADWTPNIFYPEDNKPWGEWGYSGWQLKANVSATSSIFSSLADGDSRFFIQDSGTFQSPGNVYVNQSGTFNPADKIYYHHLGRFREVWPNGYTWHSNFGNKFVWSLLLAYQPTYSGTIHDVDVTIKLYEDGNLYQTAEHPVTGYTNQQYYIDDETSVTTLYSGTITPKKLTIKDMVHTRLWWLSDVSDYDDSGDVRQGYGRSLANQYQPISGGARQLPDTENYTAPLNSAAHPVSNNFDASLLDGCWQSLSDDQHIISFDIDIDTDEATYSLTPLDSNPLGEDNEDMDGIPRYVGIELSWGDPDTAGDNTCLCPVTYYVTDVTDTTLQDMDWWRPIHDSDQSGNINILSETIQFYSRYNQIGRISPSLWYESDFRDPVTYPYDGKKYLDRGNGNKGLAIDPSDRVNSWFHQPGGINLHEESTSGILWIDTWAFKRDNPLVGSLTYRVNAWWRRNREAFSENSTLNATATANVPTDTTVNYKIFYLKPTCKLPSYVTDSNNNIIKKLLLNVENGTEITSTSTEQAYGLESKYYFGPIEPSDIYMKFNQIKQFNSGYYGTGNGNVDTRTLVTGDDTNQYIIVDTGNASVTTNSGNLIPLLGDNIVDITIDFTTGNISTS